MTQASVGFHCPTCTRSGAQRVIPARAILAKRNATPITTALIVVNVVAFLVDRSGGASLSLAERGLLFGPLVSQGEWWRIITSGFFHANLMHLGFNMFALYSFGPELERILGPARYILAYVASLLAGSVAVLAFNFGTPTLGASGAVLGLAGALAAVLWSQGIKPNQTSLGGVLIINLLLPLLIPLISFWGHLGGMVGGFMAGWLLSWLPVRYRQSPTTAMGATAGLCMALMAMAIAQT